MKYGKNLLFCCLFACLLCLTPSQASEERIIKIATTLDHGFFYLEENGALSGYNYEYLQLIAQHTGWQYEYIIVDEGDSEASYAKATALLQAGEVDLIGTMQRDEVNEALYEFPLSYTGVMRHCLYSSANNYEITQDNYFSRENLSIALIENDPINEIYPEVRVLQDIPFDIVYAKDQAEAMELLLTEQVDTLITTDTSADSWMLTYLTTINHTPFYFVADKGNITLTEELNQAILNLEVEEPDVHQRLLGEYFNFTHSGDILLTSEEMTALDDYDYLTVGFLKLFEPYQFYVSDDIPPTGISVDILDYIAGIIDMEFRYVWVEDNADIIQKLESQEIDMVATVPLNYDIGFQLDVILSRPYLSNGTTWLTRNNETTEEAKYHLVSGNIPYYSTESISSTMEIEPALLELSEKGEYSIFCDPNVSKYYLQVLDLGNIQSQTVSNISSEISLGIGKHLGTTIVGLLNHAMLHLDPFALDEIVHNHVSYQNDEMTVREFFKKYSLSILSLMTVIFSVILWFLLFQARKFRTLSQQDSLTKLYNAGYFHRYAEEAVKKSENGGLILIDIDYFKQVNDTYGHHAGDNIIILVATTLTNYFRTSDKVARLGGDEFVILIENHCHDEELKRRFSCILEDLTKKEIPVTLSIGAYLFETPHSYKQLYHMADQELYTVKEKGRNGFSLRRDTDKDESLSP